VRLTLVRHATVLLETDNKATVPDDGETLDV
jgi:hypothetical protein